MSATKNKVKYNLKNVHYALLTMNGDTPYYETPVAIPGAVSLSLSANGEPENFYADGVVYYVINNNSGYDGDLEIALIPESFRTDILNEGLDNKGVLVENSESELKHFALLFEFDGDEKHIRHVLYDCAASRPNIEGETNEQNKKVKTEKLKIKASPLPDGRVKAKTGDTTDSTTYSNWYTSVYTSGAMVNANLASLTIGSLTLTPVFSPEKTSYAVTTTSSTNVVSAAAVDTTNAEVAILVNGSSHTSGSSATWESGENSVLVVVTNGSAVKVYHVVVTKE